MQPTDPCVKGGWETAQRSAAPPPASRTGGAAGTVPSAVDRSRVWNAQEYFDALV